MPLSKGNFVFTVRHDNGKQKRVEDVKDTEMDNCTINGKHSISSSNHFFLGSVQMFGGEVDNAWLMPWLSDSIIGLLVPVMVYLFVTQKGVKLWGILLTYNALGAFDYTVGLSTQWLSPLPEEMASAGSVYLGIGVFLVFQCVAIFLLLNKNVVEHFERKR